MLQSFPLASLVDFPRVPPQVKHTTALLHPVKQRDGYPVPSGIAKCPRWVVRSKLRDPQSRRGVAERMNRGAKLKWNIGLRHELSAGPRQTEAGGPDHPNVSLVVGTAGIAEGGNGAPQMTLEHLLRLPNLSLCFSVRQLRKAVSYTH